jgi:hypothetical protein
MGVNVKAVPLETATATMTAAGAIVETTAHDGAALRMEAPHAATLAAIRADAGARAVMATVAIAAVTVMGTTTEVAGADDALALAPPTASTAVTTVIIGNDVIVIALTVFPRTTEELETSAARTASVTMLHLSSPRMSVIVAPFLSSSLRLAFELANSRSSLKRLGRLTRPRL